MSDVEGAITRAHYAEWARVGAALPRRFGDLDIAEEAAAEPLGAIDHDRLRLIPESRTPTPLQTPSRRPVRFGMARDSAARDGRISGILGSLPGAVSA